MGVKGFMIKLWYMYNLAKDSTMQIHEYKVSTDNTNHSCWGVATNSTTAVD